MPSQPVTTAKTTTTLTSIGKTTSQTPKIEQTTERTVDQSTVAPESTNSAKTSMGLFFGDQSQSSHTTGETITQTLEQSIVASATENLLQTTLGATFDGPSTADQTNGGTITQTAVQSTVPSETATAAAKTPTRTSFGKTTTQTPTNEETFSRTVDQSTVAPETTKSADTILGATSRGQSASSHTTGETITQTKEQSTVASATKNLLQTTLGTTFDGPSTADQTNGGTIPQTAEHFTRPSEPVTTANTSQGTSIGKLSTQTLTTAKTTAWTIDQPTAASETTNSAETTMRTTFEGQSQSSHTTGETITQTTEQSIVASATPTFSQRTLGTTFGSPSAADQTSGGTITQTAEQYTVPSEALTTTETTPVTSFGNLSAQTPTTAQITEQFTSQSTVASGTTTFVETTLGATFIGQGTSGHTQRETIPQTNEKLAVSSEQATLAITTSVTSFDDQKTHIPTSAQTTMQTTDQSTMASESTSNVKSTSGATFDVQSTNGLTSVQSTEQTLAPPTLANEKFTSKNKQTTTIHSVTPVGTTTINLATSSQQQLVTLDQRDSGRTTAAETALGNNSRKKRSGEDSYSKTVSLVAPFFSTISTKDNLLDYECFETFENSDQLGVSYTAHVEQICAIYQSVQRYPILSTFTFYQTIRSDYVTDEELRSRIREHSRTPINFPEMLEKGAKFDDEITLDIMGQDTKYPNLANNVFKRQLRPGDMNVVTDMVFATHGFNATWGYVATWYKVGTFPVRVDAFNSFQVILTCDDAGTPDEECDDRCLTIFDFFQLQFTASSWISSAQRSGFNDGHGFIYELPSSGTAEVRNLWAQSNIGLMGIWVFEMDQRSASPFVIPGGRLSSGLLNFHMLCSGDIRPKMSDMIRSQQILTITNCVMPAFEILEVKFSGAEFDKVVPATYDLDTLEIQCFIPDYWLVDEQVSLQLMIDSVTVFGSDTIYMYSPISSVNTALSVTDYEESFGYMNIDWSHVLGWFNTRRDIELTELIFTGINETGLELGEVLVTQLSLRSRSTLYRTPSLLPGSTSVFFRLFVISQDNRQLSSVPIFKNPKVLTCESWSQKESEKDLSLCTEEIGKWYGCPRRVSTGRWIDWLPFPDGYYAILEAWIGMSGWEQDLCCSFDLRTRSRLIDAGYCPIGRCEFNPGAAFCVRSPRLSCLEPNSQKLLYVSNQCCYDWNWNLIEDGNNPAAGTLDLQVSSMKNMAAHYWSDVLPYKECCGNSTSSQRCQVYKTYRPTVIGGYWPRNLLIGRGDPDFTTVDGVNYPFMGLGVFVMLRNILDDPSTMHISTRRVGKGSVFSGFAISHKTNRLQCYLAENGTLYLKVNNERIDYNQGPDEFVLNNITTKISEDRLGFNFTFDESGLRVNVVVMSNFLNLVVSVPPTFKNKMAGLLGYYDGDSSNDFTNSTGHVLPNDTDYYTLHKYFGDSWKVSSRNNWLFTDTQMSSLIALDIENGSPFNASYEIEFESDELRLQAEALCNNDTACLRDIALTGDLSFAEVVDVMGNMIEIAETVNDLSRINEPQWAVQDGTASPPTSDNQDSFADDDEKVDEWITIVAGIVFAISMFILLCILLFVCIKY